LPSPPRDNGEHFSFLVSRFRLFPPLPFSDVECVTSTRRLPFLFSPNFLKGPSPRCFFFSLFFCDRLFLSPKVSIPLFFSFFPLFCGSLSRWSSARLLITWFKRIRCLPVLPFFPRGKKTPTLFLCREVLIARFFSPRMNASYGELRGAFFPPREHFSPLSPRCCNGFSLFFCGTPPNTEKTLSFPLSGSPGSGRNAPPQFFFFSSLLPRTGVVEGVLLSQCPVPWPLWGLTFFHAGTVRGGGIPPC